MANYIEIKPATFNGPLPIPMSIVNNDPNGFIVSGHQIHWGGSKFNGTTINTTNDLFNAILPIKSLILYKISYFLYCFCVFLFYV